MDRIIIIIKLSLLILGCKSFAVNYSLKSGTHRHTRRWVSFPGDALPGLYCNRLQFLLVLGAFPFSFVFSKCEMHAQLDSGQVMTWPLHKQSTSFPSKTLWLLLQYALGHVHPHCEAPSNEFWSIWLNMSRLICPKHFRNHPAAFVSSHIINKYKRTSSTGSIHAHAMTLPPPCFTDEVVCLGSWAVPSFSYSYLPITLVQIDLGLICP